MFFVVSMRHFLIFNAFLCLWSLYSHAHEGEQENIDEYDRICSTHMIGVFHAYDRSKQNLEINFSTPVTTFSKAFGVIPFKTTRGPMEADVGAGWAFKPIYGHTGTCLFGANLETKSLLGMVGFNKQDKILVITYRGTQQLNDWWHNANFFRRESPYVGQNIFLHSGYLKVVENSEASLAEELKNIKSSLTTSEINDLNILITGHSLGGAVASLAAGFIKHHFPQSPIRLSVFGAPCVGGEAYNSWLKANQIVAKSFVRKTDPAPYNPSGYGCTYLGKYIELPHYGDYWFAWPMPHDNRKYQKAIYENLKRDDYKDLYSISLDWGNLDHWLIY